MIDEYVSEEFNVRNYVVATYDLCENKDCNFECEKCNANECMEIIVDYKGVKFVGTLRKIIT
jgi:hypothetical protein